MSFLDNIMNKIRPEDNDQGYLDDDMQDYGYDDEEYDSKDRQGSGKRFGLFSKKVIDGAPQGMQLITIKPNNINDYKEICDCLLEGRIVVINVEGISSDLATRIIDFTIGGVYAIDGNFQSISSYIYVATPASVDVSGDFMKDMVNDNTSNSSPKFQGYSGFKFNV